MTTRPVRNQIYLGRDLSTSCLSLTAAEFPVQHYPTEVGLQLRQILLYHPPLVPLHMLLPVGSYSRHQSPDKCSYLTMSIHPRSLIGLVAIFPRDVCM